MLARNHLVPLLTKRVAMPSPPSAKEAPPPAGFHGFSMSVASSISRAALTLALGATALSAAAPAVAGEPREIRIPVDQLDLTAPGDVAALSARVVQAARNVCRRPSHAAETSLNQRACVADAVRRAWVQIDKVDALVQADAALVAEPHAR